MFPPLPVLKVGRGMLWRPYMRSAGSVLLSMRAGQPGRSAGSVRPHGFPTRKGCLLGSHGLRTCLPTGTSWLQVLVLVGTDRLDRPLTIGQMQGKFQPVLLPQVKPIISSRILCFASSGCLGSTVGQAPACAAAAGRA